MCFSGKNTGMVRVVQKKTDQRVLLKGMKGIVKDLAFAHCLDQIILGIVDEFGNLFVFRIHENSNSDELQTELLVQINSSLHRTREHQIHRLLWCPYLSEEEEEVNRVSHYLNLSTALSIYRVHFLGIYIYIHTSCITSSPI